jgi:hypothetical protein
VVKVVEAQPSLLVLDEASPLADWARLDTEELAELIKVRGWWEVWGVVWGVGGANGMLNTAACVPQPGGRWGL